LVASQRDLHRRAWHQIQDRVGFDSALTAPLVVGAGFGLGVLASRLSPG